MGWVSAATQNEAAGQEMERESWARQDTVRLQHQLHFQPLLPRKSSQHAEQDTNRFCRGHQLLEPPPPPQPAGQTRGQTHGGKAALGNYPATGASPERERKAGLRLPGRGELRCLAAVPLSQVATVWSGVPSCRRFYGRFRADVRAELQRGPSRGISPPRCPLSSNQHRDGFS